MAKDNHALIYNKVISALENERVFLNPALSLKMLSRVIGTNTMYLSRAINEGSGGSFNRLVSNYRINFLVREALQTGETIEAVHDRYGFWSRSTFYETFRRLKGSSPWRYLEEERRKHGARDERQVKVATALPSTNKQYIYNQK